MTDHFADPCRERRRRSFVALVTWPVSARSACWPWMIGGVLLALVPLSVAAQTPPQGSGWMVGVGVVAAHDAISTIEATTRPGLTTLLGVDPWRHVSVRIEVDVPAYSTDSQTIPVAGGAFTDVTRVRLLTATPLLGVYGQLNRRVRIEALAGIAAGWKQMRITRTTRRGGVAEAPETYPSTDVGIIPVVLGADLTVAVTGRLAVAASVRLGLTPPNDFGGTLWKPGVAAHWRF